MNDRLVWIDCEMTGLNLERDALIEVAALVTDFELQVLGDGIDVVIKPPAEALELSYPLRVERYELRRGSGGAGLHRGGDGLIRELRILEPCRLSLLAQRRALPPRGARGGEDGLPGRSFLNGEELPASANLDLKPGDLLRIETPGGGGWGEPT